MQSYLSPQTLSSSLFLYTYLHNFLQVWEIIIMPPLQLTIPDK